MTQNEQKPERAEFRTREEQASILMQVICDAGWRPDDAHECALRELSQAEARGAAEQEAQSIEEAKDEGANYVLTSLALLFGRDSFEIRDVSETWEGDVNATLEGILKAGGLIDEEGDLLDLATLKDRLAEQRRKDAEGAEPFAWVSPEDVDPRNTWCNGKGYGFRILEHHSIQTPMATIPLYTRPANVAALEARVEELEGTLRNVRAAIDQADPKVLVCALWMPGQPETVVDYISAAIREGGER